MTTGHNILWHDEGGLSIIDFGLAQITEDLEPMGLDFQVLNECLKASHPSIEGAIDRVVSGYLSEGVEKKLWHDSMTFEVVYVIMAKWIVLISFH